MSYWHLGDCRAVSDERASCAAQLELAWAAGLFDGEGWFSANKTTKALELGVGQKDRRVLDRFRAAVGVGRVYEENNDFRKMHTYRATSAPEQYAVIRLLWPYLSEFKKAQAKRALSDLRVIRSELQRQVREVAEAYDNLEGVMQS